jgi:putative ABC transport system ATP-binding protein
MTGMPLIQLAGVSKMYGSGELRIAALDAITLDIQPGELVAVMGPSGSGKSTLMNILGCLDRPSAGAYLLEGEDISRRSKRELAAIRSRKIGFIFQSYNLLARASALENVILPLLYDREQRCPTRESRLAAAGEALKAVGLGDRLQHLPSELSGGQQQRVAIARALVNDPSLILADEPTGNLDSRSGEEIMGLLDQLHRKGRTIAIVTHDAGVAAHTERILRLRDGRLEADLLHGRMGGLTAERVGQHAAG